MKRGIGAWWLKGIGAWGHKGMGVLGIFLLLMGGCDYVEAPFVEKHDGGGTGSGQEKNVLIVDFTGHTCKSCPKAHHTIHQLLDLYGDRVVPVAFHLGYFARTLSGDRFTTDFRTPEGSLLEKYYDFVSFPIGAVQSLGTESLAEHGSWPSAVAGVIQQTSPMALKIESQLFPGIPALAVKLEGTVSETIDGTLKLAVWLTEDAIVDWQKNEDFDPMDIPDYVHNHVFRTSFNGLWGENLSESGGLTKGFTFAKEYSLALKAGWKPENCRVIALVYREEDKEVVQAMIQ